MATVYKVYWDNGASACGTFEREYKTEEDALFEADRVMAQNIADGVWGEDGFCEVISIERPEEIA